MKCVINNLVKNEIVVLETSKITYMTKKNFVFSTNNKFAIYICFDNGRNEEFTYGNAKTRDEEWDRIMKCWRSDEINVEIEPLTAGD